MKAIVDIVFSDIKIDYTGKFQDFSARYIIKIVIFITTLFRFCTLEVLDEKSVIL